MEFKDILVSLLSLIDVLNGAVLALSFGFLMIPSAFGYLVGAIGGVITGSVTPVSLMYENMVLSWNQSKEMRERVSMILLAALITGVIGVLGIPKFIVENIGNDIFFAVLAGVGLYLAKVGFDISTQRIAVGIPVFIVAIISQLLSNDLVITVGISVPFGLLLNYILVRTGYLKEGESLKVKKYKNIWEKIKSELKLIKPKFNTKVLVGALALTTLTIGGNIAYTATNAQLANSVATYNSSTIISSIADIVSTSFGGANMEVIISPTATAPNPVFSSVLFMFLASVLLFSGVVEKIYKWFPISVLGGYLFAIGGMVILPYNALDAFNNGDPIVMGVTISVTALTNPFFGLVAGVLSKLIIQL